MDFPIHYYALPRPFGEFIWLQLVPLSLPWPGGGDFSGDQGRPLPGSRALLGLTEGFALCGAGEDRQASCRGVVSGPFQLSTEPGQYVAEGTI